MLIFAPKTYMISLFRQSLTIIDLENHFWEAYCGLPQNITIQQLLMTGLYKHNLPEWTHFLSQNISGKANKVEKLCIDQAPTLKTATYLLQIWQYLSSPFPMPVMEELVVTLLRSAEMCPTVDWTKTWEMRNGQNARQMDGRLRIEVMCVSFQVGKGSKGVAPYRLRKWTKDAFIVFIICVDRKTLLWSFVCHRSSQLNDVFSLLVADTEMVQGLWDRRML